MMRAMQSAVSGLRAEQTAMDVIGNNIANVNTYGFKSSSVNFSDLFYQTLNNGSATVTPSQVGYGSQVSTVSKNMSTSGYTSTDSSWDLYLNGEGFFAVTTDPAGTTPQYYTRVGNFTFNSQGYLVDQSTGAYVMSYDTTSKTWSPICLMGTQLHGTDGSNTTINNTATATYPDGTFAALSNVTFNSDGTISATLGSISGTIQTTAGANVTVGIAEFLNANGLDQVGDNYYTATASSGAAQATVSGVGNSTTLKSGALESSNVDLAKEMTDMITTQRGYQANSRVITVSDSLLEELVNLKRS